MKTVIVASKNPVKLRAAQLGFTRIFPTEVFQFTGEPVPSGVSDQPMSSAETLLGAYQRAQAVRAGCPEADFWVGIEGGVEECPPGAIPEALAGARLAAFAWIVILNRSGVGKARTGTLFLPPRVAELVHAGKELGEADDIVFGRTNSKQENGAVGLLTGNAVDRAAFYEQAVILALAPFYKPELY